MGCAVYMSFQLTLKRCTGGVHSQLHITKNSVEECVDSLWNYNNNTKVRMVFMCLGAVGTVLNPTRLLLLQYLFSGVAIMRMFLIATF